MRFAVLTMYMFTLLAATACGQQTSKEAPKTTVKTTQKMINKMKVEVWSDIMCPFCYIGKRQYEAALKQFENSDRVEIVWKSFQLDPSIPEDVEKGMTSARYLATRKGISETQVAAMHQQVMQMARNAGLVYNLDGAVVYNSFKAHRIIQLAKTKGLGDVAEERFFHAHFIENKDLGDKQVLLALAKEIGLNEKDAEDALTSDTFANLVQQDVEEARQIGVTGVPFFVFNRKYAVSGAQPVEAFLETLQKSYAEWSAANSATDLEVVGGNVCKPDGSCE